MLWLFHFRSFQGLSPLARGNQSGAQSRAASLRPIPARAGEPGAAGCCCTVMGAYPRSRGGTSLQRVFRIHAKGLSPLARGNHNTHPERAVQTGPIPARAGEPSARSASRSDSRAYPRSRGGTYRRWCQIEGEKGLSPLARGNLFLAECKRESSGPIPARAGEPVNKTKFMDAFRAYPRSRGGTDLPLLLQFHGKGLSPLARGNLLAPSETVVSQGPIPARAGEPIYHSWEFFVEGAYPRSRGGTIGYFSFCQSS